MTSPRTSTSAIIEVPTEAQKLSNLIRFETELEFVQCLANPFYLQSLAQQDLFADEAFLNYLTYLKYFKQPSYARFIQYPQSLHNLDLLQHSQFREALKNQTVVSELAGKQLGHWASWRERSTTLTVGVNGINGTMNGGGGENGVGKMAIDEKVENGLVS